MSRPSFSITSHLLASIGLGPFNFPLPITTICSIRAVGEMGTQTARVHGRLKDSLTADNNRVCDFWVIEVLVWLCLAMQ